MPPSSASYVAGARRAAGADGGSRPRAKSTGCVDCHAQTDQATMHASPAVVLGCTDCHGGDAAVRWHGGAAASQPDYAAARDRAHVLPRYPEAWRYPASANPERSYTLLNREAPEFIRFVNPRDYRVAREACGACHLKTILAAERSLMSTNAMFWGGAAYNNGLLPFKNYLLGEAYTRDGEAAIVEGAPASAAEQRRSRHHRHRLYPLPRWENLKPADIFRVFEDGGRNISNLFPETGPAECRGQIQRLEEPGRPDMTPVESRTGHRRAHRRAGAQHPQDAPQRSAGRGSSAPTTSPATTARPAAAPATCLRQRPRPAPFRTLREVRPRRH